MQPLPLIPEPSPQKETPYPGAVTPHSPLSRSLATTNLSDSPILDNSYEWNHITCPFMSVFFHSAQCLQGSRWCSMDQGFVLSESALLTSSPGSSDEWVSGRKRIANAHREKLPVITQVHGLSARCACLRSPTGNGQCRLLASSRLQRLGRVSWCSGGRYVSMDRSLAALGTGQINCKRDSHKGIWSQLKDFNAHYALEKPSPRKQVTKSLNQQELSFRNLA